MENDKETLAELHSAAGRIVSELSKIIVGQQDTIEQLLIALFAGGHCLLVGVPGLAKTLMVSSLAQVLDLQFSRIQFTPDLMPSDITGTEVIQEDRSTGRREFRFISGPVFANIILADEINRTPPKTQSALLEAMQERQVTAGGKRHVLPSPFFVLATQNPIEQEGTYPLPEAQLDRFMFHVWVDYPDEEDELQIVLQTTGSNSSSLSPILDSENLSRFLQVVRRIPVAEPVARLAMQIARLTRPSLPTAPEIVRKCVSWGAGPRGSQYLVLGAKARAALNGKPLVTNEDILAVAMPVLRHRLKLNFQAEAEGVSAEQIIQAVIDVATGKPAKGTSRETLSQVFRS
jgi:MoxR-like ATPase